MSSYLSEEQTGGSQLVFFFQMYADNLKSNPMPPKIGTKMLLIFINCKLTQASAMQDKQYCICYGLQWRKLYGANGLCTSRRQKKKLKINSMSLRCLLKCIKVSSNNYRCIGVQGAVLIRCWVIFNR